MKKVDVVRLYLLLTVENASTVMQLKQTFQVTYQPSFT